MSGSGNGINSWTNNIFRTGQPGLLPSMYGSRSFESNAEAHTFINTVLNSGSGNVGTLAYARNLTTAGPPNPMSPFNNAGDRAFSFPADVEGRNQVIIRGSSSTTDGYTGSIGLHGTMGSVLNRPVPASCIFLRATIDTPIRPQRETPSPTQSISSTSSYASAKSSHPRCSYCGGCLYCANRAARCRVRGLGFDSSDDADSSDSGAYGSPVTPDPEPQGPRNSGIFFG